MKKVAIVGCGGAGKSTLARQLGHILDLPVIHLDAEFWQPGWKMVSKEEELRLIQKIISQQTWIIDGNYSSTMNLRLADADTIIFLDFSTLLCLWRVLKRRIKYWGKSRPDMNPGCLEKIDWSFFWWILTFRAIQRPRVLQSIDIYAAGRNVLIFERPRQVEQFLETLAPPTRQFN
ncbi:DNA topology modulation protein [Spirosoma sp. KNUC1025]|uniref:DNA topology modulation protein n=1 Tax=Spirosoma sp. KNUC1025 TaxID=2894082 RepID=UPI00386FC6CB|nr:DNA topology modulation protein [Spirosoma sp. KNUC1025]